MVFFRIWKYFNPLRCDFCNDTDIQGELIYQKGDVFVEWHYHQKCLTDVVCFPEKHPNKMGMAYHLTRAIKDDEEREQNLIKYLKTLKDEYCMDKPQPPSDRIIKEGEQPAKL